MALSACVVSAQAQELPRIAVYVTGDVPDNEKSALGTRMLASLVNSGRYKGIERSSAFLAEIDKEQEKQRSGAIDDGHISELGKQFGVKFVCIANITPVLGDFQVSARIINVETAEIEFIGESASSLKNIIDLVNVSDQVVKNMFGEQAKSARAAEPATPAAEPVPEPKAERQARPKPTPSATPPSPAAQPRARSTRPAPEPQSAREPKAPTPKPQIRTSVGAGAFFVNDGGGMTWQRSDGQVAMPRAGGGAHLFMDVAYAEISIALSASGGEWESQSAEPGKKYDMQRSSVNIGALAKYPIAAGSSESIKLFPIIGLEYEASTSAKIVRNDKSEYKFDGKEGRYNAGDLSALWVKFGGGADVGLGDDLYIRAELLYGARTANELEKSGGEGAKTIGGHGVTFRVGVGYRF